MLVQITNEEKATLCTKGSTMEQVDGMSRLDIPNFHYVGASCAICAGVVAGFRLC